MLISLLYNVYLLIIRTLFYTFYNKVLRHGYSIAKR